jgi:hypothetical protein
LLISKCISPRTDVAGRPENETVRALVPTPVTVPVVVPLDPANRNADDNVPIA